MRGARRSRGHGVPDIGVAGPWLLCSLSSSWVALWLDPLWGLSVAEPGLLCGSWCDTDISGSSNIHVLPPPLHVSASLAPNWGPWASSV